MLRKTISASPKTSCDRQSGLACFNTKKSEKIFSKPKKVVISKKPHIITSSASQDGKCSSTGKISSKTLSTSTRHVTKSDLNFIRKQPKKVIFDHYHECGDTSLTKANNFGEDEDDFLDSVSNTTAAAKKKEKLKTDKLKAKIVEKPKSIEQYYKNENFQRNSGHEMRNATKKESDLLPIKELPEIVKDSSSDYYLTSEKTSVEDRIRMATDSDKQESLRQLKEFRDRNYFECHSSATRISSKADATSLKDHKCKYRFYLNDRLFPVPLNSDHNNTIRCVDCLLPYEETRPKVGSRKVPNGTIQAKVKLDDDGTQDVTLLLPVQEPLIIREKRIEKCNCKPQDDVVYFGIVRLTPNGHSVFNRNLPDDSLALKYQKGYREFSVGDVCRYEVSGQGDVVFI